ncbi:DUF2279 domain-containing protein [Zobellella maritima]|uniref:DUF2279 domain-containing protein n=1 Tax=Zobellella maritima TaxID=2059725 RepID=UPI0013004C3D|nr:DUF2279 domain-containing protein [Zobellella maritima]
MTLIIGKACRRAWLLTMLLHAPTVLSQARAACDQPLPAAQQQQRLKTMVLAGTGLITLWGVTNWDYFSRSPQSQSEGWFGPNTDEGGVDKLGHLYSVYVTSQALGSLYEHWCFNAEDTARYGALTSFAIFGYMELGDAFSDFGFSYEDFIANAAGSAASYYFSSYPALAEKMDIRWEYGLKPQQADVFTDYENTKYLVALKLAGFDATRQGPLKYLELHLGYYARGFDDPTQIRERNLYLGLGINLSELFRLAGYNKTATLFNYYQPPGTYIATD